ncbi:MAG TPA: DNA polymerase Y family protein, partial [Xanthobacteraceae bacterium]|nr:DNA polymerase Y family protein [Xanthobacteraceae bacterium]
MSRIVSVWLPRWSIRRFVAAQAIGPADQPVDPDRPFVLVIAASGGPRIAALNEAAAAAGLAIGEPVADARAKAGFLQLRAADAKADDAALRRLSLWATRYTPTASPWTEADGGDGFFLDVEGASHLFGGEAKLIADLAGRLERFGLPARLAVAATPGMAWAASHYHSEDLCVLAAGQEAAALAPMPIAALRLSAETRFGLRRLGFKTVGALMDQPRAPFAARFAAELLRRLDQALGRVDEPLIPIAAPPVYHSLQYLLEPIVTKEAVIARAGRLMQTLAHALSRDDVGARVLRLCLYRVDGAVESLDIGLTAPTRSVAHVTRLLDLKLEALAVTQDAGFGFETVGLAVIRAEPMPARQTELTSAGEAGDTAERCAALIDALRQRLGSGRVRRFEAIASHLPERAEATTEINGEVFPPPARGRVGGAPSRERDGDPGAGVDAPTPQQPRPLLLLPRAEPTEVTALVPDGPPRRFSWRGTTYDVAGAQGPERIRAEWWREPSPPPQRGPRRASAAGCPSEGREGGLTRDYYLVEDGDGRR